MPGGADIILSEGKEPVTLMTENPAPSASTIVRLVEQSIEEQRDTRARLDAHIEITKMRFAGVENLLESVRSTATAQFLTLSGELSDLKKHVLQIEEHVAFLTTKTVEHDKRFDAVDEQFDAVDERFDAVDERFDAVDKRFDAVDKRFDAVDKRFDEHDRRFDEHDRRFDEHDKRFDEHDRRFDAVDKRFDGIDRRLDALTGMVEQIRDAVVSGRGGDGREE